MQPIGLRPFAWTFTVCKGTQGHLASQRRTRYRRRAVRVEFYVDRIVGRPSRGRHNRDAIAEAS